MKRALIVLLLAGASAASAQDADLLARARALLRTSPLIDGHNDFPMALQENNAQRDLDKLDILRPQPKIHTDIPRLRQGGVGGQFWRSEEHTSELQSQSNLVCRLLLEKKKKK